MSALEQLRARTGAWHRRLEAELPLLAANADERVYARYLAGLWGFHAPLERSLSRVPGLPRTGLSLERRRKTSALIGDLEALGLSRSEISRLPWCGFTPSLADVPSALGCLYVLEGATLGGQVVYRELLRRMPGVVPRASRYLRIYGDQTGARWREFTGVLDAFSYDPGGSAVLVDTACATFEALHRWLVVLPGAAGVGRDVVELHPLPHDTPRRGAPLDG